MSAGTWLVLVESARAISLADLSKRIRHLRHAKLREEGDVLVVEVAMGVPTELTVGFSAESHVPLENRELAESARRPELAKLDARYEILFDLERADDVYNALALIAGELEKACDGVIYDMTNARFV